jgi:heme A synthase
MKELWLELTFLIGGDSLRATKAGYADGQWRACHGVTYVVKDGDGF